MPGAGDVRSLANRAPARPPLGPRRPALPSAVPVIPVLPRGLPMHAFPVSVQYPAPPPKLSWTPPSPRLSSTPAVSWDVAGEAPTLFSWASVIHTKEL